jgi:hypothetical protein
MLQQSRINGTATQAYVKQYTLAFAGKFILKKSLRLIFFVLALFWNTKFWKIHHMVKYGSILKFFFLKC